MEIPHVLQVGIDPSAVDFSAWPGQSAGALRVRIDAARDQLRDAGFAVSVCLLPDDADAAETVVRSAMASRTFDTVEIGAGLRTSDAYTEVFERAVNTVVACQPGVSLCFNESPETTLAAVRRGLGR